MPSKDTSYATTVSPEYSSTAEEQENEFKINLMKMIEDLKEEINKSIEEIKENTNKQLKEINKTTEDEKMEIEAIKEIQIEIILKVRNPCKQTGMTDVSITKKKN